jgi:hypothetical protein
LPLSYHSSFFKVLAIVADTYKNDYLEYNNLYTYSSADPVWSEPTNCFDRRFHEPYLVSLQWRNKVVVCSGMAHWLVVSAPAMYYILSVCIETGNISVKELLLPTELHSTTRYIGGPTLFVTATGSLSLFWLQVEGGLALDIWTETEDGAWPYARRVKPTPPKNWNPSLVHMWSGEKSGVLIITNTFHCVHMVDVESGVMEDVSDQFQSSWGMMVVPMEIDWPALFMSRLGGG